MIFIPPPVERYHFFIRDNERVLEQREALRQWHDSLSAKTCAALRAEAVSLIVKHLPHIRRIFGGRC